MLAMLECFIIKFTIPELINEKSIISKLPSKEYESLLKTIKRNKQLFSGMKVDDPQFVSIQEFFLQKLNVILGDGDHLKILPSDLRYFKVPSLRELTRRFLIRHKKLLSSESLRGLPLELRESLMEDPIKIIEPFGSLGAEEAFQVLTTIYELLEIELTEDQFNTQQNLRALEIALMCEGPSLSIKYLKKLTDLTGHTKELLQVLKVAIKHHQNEIFFDLLDLKSDFVMSNYVVTLLTAAATNDNMQILKFVLDRLDLEKVDLDKLKKNKSILHGAAKSGNPQLVRYLLGLTLVPKSQIKFDPTLRNELGLLPLHYALSGDSIPVFSLLLPYVEKDLIETDHFHLFRIAALNGRLRLIRYLVEEGFNKDAKNAKKETLPEHLTKQLNKKMETEKEHWNKIFSPFNEINKGIKFLLNNDLKPVETSKLRLHKYIVKDIDEMAPSNIELRNNLTNLLDNNVIGGNVNLYQRYIKHNNKYETLLIVYFIVITVAWIGLGITGGVIKYQIKNHDCKQENEVLCSDDIADSLMIIGSFFFLIDMCSAIAIKLPRKNIPCSPFFRNNPGPQDHQDDPNALLDSSQGPTV